MPSSLIFAGLVVLWLLILVPAVARHRQEVARPSVAALAGRVLARPRRRIQERRNGRLPTEEGDSVDPERLDRTTRRRPARRSGPGCRPGVRPGSTSRSASDERRRARRERRRGRADGVDDESDVRWERPPPRYRPGRGGYDPEADAVTARRALRLPAAGRADAAGVRAAARGSQPRPRSRWSGGRTRRSTSCSSTTWSTCVVRSGWRRRSATAGPPAWPAPVGPWRPTTATSTSGPDAAARSPGVRCPTARTSRPTPRRPTPRKAGSRRSATPGPTRTTTTPRASGASASPWACCPPGGAAWTTRPPSRRAPSRRLQPTPPPPIPAGTSLVVVDDDELDLHDLGTVMPGSHRRAVGE